VWCLHKQTNKQTRHLLALLMRGQQAHLAGIVVETRKTCQWILTALVWVSVLRWFLILFYNKQSLLCFGGGTFTV